METHISWIEPEVTHDLRSSVLNSSRKGRPGYDEALHLSAYYISKL